MNTDNRKNLSFFKKMLKIRLTEETIAEKYPEGKMRCPTHLSIGQEGVASGVCANLTNDDLVLSTHRSHAHYLAKNGNLNKMIAEIYGKSSGCSSGKGGSMHLIDTSVGFMGSTAIVGNTIPLGVGLGLSIKLKNEKNISCVFFGDGSIEEGVFYESVNFAVLKKLPVLFICEDNLYSVYSPMSVRQPEDRIIHEMVKAQGIQTFYGNGNDISEVSEITKNAIDNIRRGCGPQFLQFSTYRWREHCGPNYDNDIGYRTEEEFELWKLKDPIKHCEDNLINDDKKKINKLKIEIQKEVDSAFEFAENSPFPKSEEAFKDLFN